MTEQAARVTQPGPEPGTRPRPSAGIARAATLITVLTVVARLLGLGRQLAFAHTAGAYCLGAVCGLVAALLDGGDLRTAAARVRPGGAPVTGPGAAEPG